MRSVKTKKELINAIKDGEKRIRIDSLNLYAACKLAETYTNVSSLLKHYIIKNMFSVFGSAGTMNFVCSGTVVTVTITISVLITAMAIIAILNDKKVKIKCTGLGGKGEIEIG